VGFLLLTSFRHGGIERRVPSHTYGDATTTVRIHMLISVLHWRTRSVALE
jgi:hypothetical protein